MFKNNNKHNRAMAIHVVLVPLLSTLNIFYILFWCFHCWLWTRKCLLGNFLEYPELADTGIRAFSYEYIYPVVFLLTGKIYINSGQIFPRLGKIYFGCLLGGKILQETNIRNRWHKLDKKLLSCTVHNHVRAAYTYFICVWKFYV